MNRAENQFPDLSLPMAILLGARLQHSALKPLTQRAEVVRTISCEKDHSQCAMFSRDVERVLPCLIARPTWHTVRTGESRKGS